MQKVHPLTENGSGVMAQGKTRCGIRQFPRFGSSRLWRPDLGTLERTYFKLFGLADPAHYIRSEYFKRFASGVTPPQILDLGCGAGDYSFYMAEQFPESRVLGMDENKSLIERNLLTRDRMHLSNLDFSVQDLRALDEREAYDFILCVESLQYVERPDVVIQQCERALKKGGHLFIHMPLKRYRQVPLHRCLKEFHADEVVATRTQDEIIAMIADAKLTVKQSQNTFAYYAGELACSLFCMFYKDTLLNRLMQGFVSPGTRLLGWLELRRNWSKGFALAILAQKLEWHAR